MIGRTPQEHIFSPFETVLTTRELRPLLVARSCMFMGLSRSGMPFEGGDIPRRKGSSPGNSTRGILVCKLFVERWTMREFSDLAGDRRVHGRGG